MLNKKELAYLKVNIVMKIMKRDENDRFSLRHDYLLCRCCCGNITLIAGIGVMNVMYISVTERTEEIAIRRAFGAKGRDIEIQFLVESVVLCLIGGIIGLILGIIIATLIDLVTPEMVKSSVSLGSVILAVGVSTLIGIIFGWIPARSASKKN